MSGKFVTTVLLLNVLLLMSEAALQYTNQQDSIQYQPGSSQYQPRSAQYQRGYAPNQRSYAPNQRSYAPNQQTYTQNQPGYAQNQLNYAKNQPVLYQLLSSQNQYGINNMPYQQPTAIIIRKIITGPTGVQTEVEHKIYISNL